jgi:hypothetical protein
MPGHFSPAAAVIAIIPLTLSYLIDFIYKILGLDAKKS